MKGIILAGGSATRLRPASYVVSKQLMPIYDKPLIYYPLTTLMLAGIREILLISTPIELPRFKDLFSDSENWGIELQFAEQASPNGLAESLLIGQDFIGADPVCLILGDNLFHGNGLGRDIAKSFTGHGALISAYKVTNPHEFGVIEIASDGSILSIEEKPKSPKSNWVIPGIYFYDQSSISKVKNQKPSARGELEISDLNQSFLREGKLQVMKLPRGTTWLDMGTPNAMLEGSQYIRTIQERQGLLIGSPEEAAWRNGWISFKQLKELALKLQNSSYGQALLALKESDIK